MVVVVGSDSRWCIVGTVGNSSSIIIVSPFGGGTDVVACGLSLAGVILLLPPCPFPFLGLEEEEGQAMMMCGMEGDMAAKNSIDFVG